MKNGYHKLDNPVWHSLSETHRHLSVDYGGIKFYQPDYCPFGGAVNASDNSKYIDEYASLLNDFFVVGEKPRISNQLFLKRELGCLQMILDEVTGIEIKDDIVQLTDEHSTELFQLVNLVQPGYFKLKTYLLGNYFGIFKNGQLVSVTGERMQMNEFVEISAIITHPSHTGKGYAKQLIAHTANNIFSRGKMPFLHVADTNIGAIELYKKSGFTTRRKMSFWNITK